MSHEASRRRLPGGAVFVAWLVLLPAVAAAATPEETFKANCSGCHTIGGGATVGPDLEGVVERLGAETVAAMIRDPQSERPGSTMPKLGLAEADIAAIVTMLSQGSGGDASPPPPPPPATSGDPERGKNLFEGSNRFESDGPPCLSCHSIAGIGSLGGGQLGPDLTGAYEKLGGEQGLTSWLSAMTTATSPTMAPIFTGRPLTAAEQSDLVAFMKQASTADRPSNSVWALLLLGLGGAVLGVLLAFLLWPRRRLVVRRTIVDPPTIREG